MRIGKEISLLVSRLPRRKILFGAFLLLWALLSTVVPIPASSSGTGGDGPC
ncbi:MAG: hypothetical protein ACXAEL_14185 [Candidatus Hodarchaeales archaeon]